MSSYYNPNWWLFFVECFFIQKCWFLIDNISTLFLWVVDHIFMRKFLISAKKKLLEHAKTPWSINNDGGYYLVMFNFESLFKILDFWSKNL